MSCMTDYNKAMEEIGLRDRNLRELDYEAKDREHVHNAYDKARDMIAEARSAEEVLAMLEEYKKKKEAIFADQTDTMRKSMQGREPSEREKKLEDLREDLQERVSLEEKDKQDSWKKSKQSSGKQEKSSLLCCF